MMNTDLIPAQRLRRCRWRSLRSKRLEGWTKRMDSRPSFETPAYGGLLRMRCAAGAAPCTRAGACSNAGRGSLRRELANRPQPILDMVGANHLAAFEGVNVDRHQLE